MGNSQNGILRHFALQGRLGRAVKLDVDWKELLILIIPTLAFALEDLPPSDTLQFLSFFYSVFTLNAYLQRRHPQENFPLWFWGCSVWISSVYFLLTWRAHLPGGEDALLGPAKILILGLALVRYRSLPILFASSLTIDFADPVGAVVSQLMATGFLWYGYFSRSPRTAVLTAPPARFMRFVLLAVLVFVLAAYILNPAQQWVHPEVSEEYFLNIMRHSGSGWVRWLDVFDMRQFDVALWSRPRFLSNFFMILDTQIRWSLPQLSSVYPAFSVTSVLATLLTPFFLFLYLARTWGKNSAYAGVALFVSSCGFLSGALFRFHPGKPLTLLFVSVLLVLAQWLENSLRSQGPLTTKQRLAIAGLLLLQFFSYLLDEMALFSWVLIPLLHPRLIFSRRTRLRYWQLAPVVAYLFCITWLAPLICQRFGYAAFSFWKLAIQENTGLREVVNSMLLNLVFHVRLVFPFSLLEAESIPQFRLSFLLAQALGMGCFALSIFLVAKKFSRRQKWLFVRQLTCWIAFIVFYSVILSRHGRTFTTDYYYGALASLLTALSLAGLFQGSHPVTVWWERGFLLLLLAGQLLIFPVTHRAWMAMHLNANRSFTQDIGSAQSWTKQMASGQLPLDNWLLHETRLRLLRNH